MQDASSPLASPEAESDIRFQSIPQLDGDSGDILEETEDLLENCKNILDNLLRDSFDKFEVLALALQFNVDLDRESSFSKQKYLIQKTVLDNIIKQDKSEYYIKLLSETEEICKIKKSSGYSCCLPGCPYNADRHRNYVKHLKQIHPNYHKLSCQFRHSCKREFTSVELLEEHVKLDHNLKDAETPSAQLPAINVATKCDLLSCRP